MLDHHPEVAFDKELDFVVTMVSDAGELPPPEAFREWVVTVRGMDYAVDPSLSYRELVNDFLRQKSAASGAKPYIGATIHRNFDRLRFLWPDARYVHLLRDPRDVARSVVQKGWAGNVYHASEYWLDAERCWSSLSQHLVEGQAIDVRYEGLVTRTEQVLSAICGFIGVDYSPKMLEYPADAPQYPPPDAGLVAQWRRRLDPDDVALVEARTGAMLLARGYAPSGYPPAEVGRLRHQLLLAEGRLKRFGSRLAIFGPRVVALDVFARRLGLRSLARHARRRMNAIEQRMIDEESAGLRAPSANIPPAAHSPVDESERPSP
jgi:hypothetical protein